uniref:ATP synthase complex subunit 8 n=1 Tax=Inimicus japonicus TaxID=652442 RepID=A0A7L7TEQ2_INIJA|nr:ATP synthase F0 subunit 8 [Inimicus japonicus]QOC70771.1 ATP synthase F0 subunit 8 [Inimicus japonicus]UOA66678.1 ATP synthase F0 subunit 8 [Inimicus japonicus]
MPQLNPTPWLMILVASWLIFLTIIPTKIMAHNYPNEPTLQSAEKPKTQPWSWPWY